MLNIKSIARQTIGGGHSAEPKVIVDCAEIDGKYEIAALRPDGSELDIATADTLDEAMGIYRKILYKHMLPLQRAVFIAQMEPGKRYTLLSFNEFGFPYAMRFTFRSYETTTYAQHGDAVKMICVPWKKRSTNSVTLYNKSFAIFRGWHELPDEVWHETIRDDETVRVTRTTYESFSAEMFDRCVAFMSGNSDQISCYKNFRTGVNGRVYA